MSVFFLIFSCQLRCFFNQEYATPTGVGICVAGQPWHRRRLHHGRESAMEDFLSGSLWGIRRVSTRERGHLPASETGGTGPSRPKTDGPWKLYGTLCHHRTPHRGSQGLGGITYGRPLGLPPRGTDGSLEAEHTACRGGPGGDHFRGPSPRRT